ncbi:hypothetical protein BK666_04790 [Pseudomonas frederiksbergensis]|uniref:Uncharacterized protein n=1 Tax=Pseudomonas frederiksbergensis TaxID=104087 RepID=A0A423KEY2_9PSED|nr:hypothetical protein BK666_04790 [Pseudomonas frederiksbergensis]
MHVPTARRADHVFAIYRGAITAFVDGHHSSGCPVSPTHNRVVEYIKVAPIERHQNNWRGHHCHNDQIRTLVAFRIHFPLQNLKVVMTGGKRGPQSQTEMPRAIRLHLVAEVIQFVGGCDDSHIAPRVANPLDRQIAIVHVRVIDGFSNPRRRVVCFGFDCFGKIGFISHERSPRPRQQWFRLFTP